jgi:hypothetical protein
MRFIIVYKYIYNIYNNSIFNYNDIETHSTKVAKAVAVPGIGLGSGVEGTQHIPLVLVLVRGDDAPVETVPHGGVLARKILVHQLAVPTKRGALLLEYF